MTYKYEFTLNDEGKKVVLELSVPINKLGKRDRKKLVEWMHEEIDAVSVQAKVLAYGEYMVCLEKAKKLKEEWGFD